MAKNEFYFEIKTICIAQVYQFSEKDQNPQPIIEFFSTTGGLDGWKHVAEQAKKWCIANGKLFAIGLQNRL